MEAAICVTLQLIRNLLRTYGDLERPPSISGALTLFPTALCRNLSITLFSSAFSLTMGVQSERGHPTRDSRLTCHLQEGPWSRPW